MRFARCQERLRRHNRLTRPFSKRVLPAIEFLEARLTPSGSPYTEPTLIQSKNGVLTATLTETIAPAKIGDTQVVNAWTYSYNGVNSYVGPTLQLNPGDTLDLTIVNQLGEPTNLHTHGLHVSPLGNADDVLLDIEPDGENHYHIQIPIDHPQGLYWYHPHHHGFVDDQIVHGLSGLIEIGRPDGEAPQLNGLVQNVMALKNALLAGNQVVVPVDGTDHTAQTFTVNGLLNPVLTMQPNEWRVFNVANIGNDAFYTIKVVDSLNKPVSPELLAVAEDGNPFTSVGNAGGGPAVGMPPGRRWSFLVHAPANPAPGDEYRLVTDGFNTNDPTNIWPKATLLTIQFAGPTWVGPSFAKGSPLSPPTNLYHDLRTIPASQIAAFRTVVFGNDGMNELINGQSFPNNTIFQPRLNTVEEWTLLNPTPNDHPFHLHTNPQQVVSSQFQQNGLPLFTDVILVPGGTPAKPGQTTIRIEFTDFLGTIVYHCHRVDHEDEGMMAQVTMIPEVPTYAVGANADHLPEVKVYNPLTGAVWADFLAYDPSYTGGVNVAVADVNGDGVYDIVTGRSQGTAEVKVIDGTKLNQVDPKTGEILPGALLGDFLAFVPGFQGGVNVAAADINGDGLADVITGAGPGGQPLVRIIDATKLNQVGADSVIQDSALLGSFLAFEPNFAGGVRVAAGDITGNGRFDIIAGKGPGADPLVKIFDGTDLSEMARFLAFEPTFTGGVSVGTGNIKGFAFDDIIVGKGPGSDPVVKIFTDQSASEMDHAAGLMISQIDSFLAYDPAYRGGVRVTSLQDSTPLPTYGGNKDDVVTTPTIGTGLTPSVFPLTIPASTSSFVNGLYRDVLDRPQPATPMEVDGWVTPLDAGQLTRVQVAEMFQASPEGSGIVVDQIYLTYLGRPADAAGRASWVAALGHGATAEQVELAFATSPEYMSKFGSTDTTYVQSLFQNVLGRAADSNGLSFWVGELSKGTSRATVALDFLNSVEKRTLVVNSDYNQFLGRSADATGLNSWLAALASGMTWEQVEASILSAPEYQGLRRS